MRLSTLWRPLALPLLLVFVAASAQAQTFSNTAFIAAPARAIAGTRMAFAGINSPAQRADVIAYLRSISPNAPAP